MFLVWTQHPPNKNGSHMDPMDPMDPIWIRRWQVIPKHVYVDEGSSSLENAFRAYRFSLIVDDERSISQALIHSIAWATCCWHQVVVKFVTEDLFHILFQTWTKEFLARPPYMSYISWEKTCFPVMQHVSERPFSPVCHCSATVYGQG